MLRALVAANFNTIYIYTAEVSFGKGVGYIRVQKMNYLGRTSIHGQCTPTSVNF
jgi:hypothetical protein